MRNFKINTVAVVAGLLFLFRGPVVQADSARIVENGQARGQIMIPAKADPQIRQAAELLARCLKESSGAVLPIQEEGALSNVVAGAVSIHVGRDAYVQNLKLSLDSLDGDGFLIHGVDATNLVVAGPTAFGTEFGVDEFLERYVGVRWLMPGPNGEDIPSKPTLDIPIEEVRSEPVFFSRLFSGLNGEVDLTWARRNRMHGRVEFHHNLLNLFPPSKYGQTHPEFYPVQGSVERFIPPNDHTHGWQPCFSATGTIAVAVETINRFFDEHPEVTSYSLGVTDSGGHCECAQCRARETGKNYLGRRDVSNAYFEWCNAIVEQVLKKHPDKYFGVLAYHEVAAPPTTVKVNPRIIPFLTYDRMKWSDPELRAQGEQLTRDWHKMSPIFGWYDYIYGSFYHVPRVWFSLMADYYRFARDNGVKAMYAEAYPSWGEGPKFYLSLKLQWDPSQDVNALAHDWYVRAVGQDAAGDLAAYYEHWTDFWTRRVLKSRWFTKGGEYLPYKQITYLNDVTPEEMAASRTLLENVIRKCRTDKQKARAQVLMHAFEEDETAFRKYKGLSANAEKSTP